MASVTVSNTRNTFNEETPGINTEHQISQRQVTDYDRDKSKLLYAVSTSVDTGECSPQRVDSEAWYHAWFGSK